MEEAELVSVDRATGSVFLPIAMITKDTSVERKQENCPRDVE